MGTKDISAKNQRGLKTGHVIISSKGDMLFGIWDLST